MMLLFELLFDDACLRPLDVGPRLLAFGALAGRQRGILDGLTLIREEKTTRRQGGHVFSRVDAI